jgi:hypothetical protein
MANKLCRCVSEEHCRRAASGNNTLANVQRKSRTTSALIQRFPGLVEDLTEEAVNE